MGIVATGTVTSGAATDSFEATDSFMQFERSAAIIAAICIIGSIARPATGTSTTPATGTATRSHTSESNTPATAAAST